MENSFTAIEPIKRKTYSALLLYVLAAIFIYPVVAHIVMDRLGIFKGKLPYGSGWLFIQIMLSAPGLIVIGKILYSNYGYKLKNKILGAILILAGVYWLYLLVSDIMLDPNNFSFE